MEKKAHRFIQAIKALNEEMKIPEKISGIQEKDIQTMVERAYREANPLYPVPKILSKQALTRVYHIIRETK